ncbi:MAG: hypothetical protein CVT73_07105 [Alphaproteobacteria bacterium HGW-Alphaproteobacteria-12]|nr:MAG: hypothetical protein CVT73_07105 [Alphaproteobacteria bacterium HGW-Alphaproteobacteria-12]
MNGNTLKAAVAIGAMLVVTACSSDGSSSLGGGGGGGGTPSTVTALGVTGEGGATEALGLSELTDPLLGTEGVLGGGGEGAIGGQLPDELVSALEPLASGLAPVTDALGQVPLGMITGQLPALGISGEGGVGEDLLGQDLTGMLLGETGTVPALLGSGEEGALGALIPEGALPGLPGGDDGDDPLAPITDLLGGGLPGGDGGDPLAPVTDLLGGAGGLGVTGDGGLLADLAGSDPLGSAIEPVPVVSTLLSGGNDGALGGLAPEGGLPLPSAP